jgi:hypothetical protein
MWRHRKAIANGETTWAEVVAKGLMLPAKRGSVGQLGFMPGPAENAKTPDRNAPDSL